MSKDYKIDTRLVQEDESFEEGAVNKPIYQSTSFAYQTAEELARVFTGKAAGFTYSRLNNPTNAAFEAKIARLEGGIGAVSCASGMAAISTAILSLVEQGDRIVAGNSLFGGTYNFLKNDLTRWGIKTVFVEATDPESYQEAINDQTRLVYVETVGNPKLDIPDIRVISSIAHNAGVPLVVDNTLMTPYLFKARDFGADIVIHSTSKFINGNASSIGGIIVDLGTFNWQDGNFPLLKDYLQYGSFCYLAKIRQDLFRNLGGCASPFNIYLNSLGLGTLAVRMDKHCDNARKLAEFLQEKDGIKRVNYPGLPSHPDHEVARRQFKGKYGGLLTFELEDEAASFKMINNLQLAKNLPNLGDIRTLVIHPASTIYSNVSPEKQRELGVTPGLIRISVGIENPEDIINDFDRALSSLEN